MFVQVAIGSSGHDCDDGKNKIKTLDQGTRMKNPMII